VNQAEGMEGREHNPYGFTCFLAGAGVKGGMQHGAPPNSATGPWRAAPTSTTCTPPCSTSSKSNHERITCRYSGCDFRLTDVYGNVVKEILS
jgi:uncharacterized protein DUF1501